MVCTLSTAPRMHAFYSARARVRKRPCTRLTALMQVCFTVPIYMCCILLRAHLLQCLCACAAMSCKHDSLRYSTYCTRATALVARVPVHACYGAYCTRSCARVPWRLWHASQKRPCTRAMALAARPKELVHECYSSASSGKG